MTSLAPELLHAIEQAICSLRYGTVQIYVHDARVVQIEKHERVRLADLSSGSLNPQSPTDRTTGVPRPSHGRA